MPLVKGKTTILKEILLLFYVLKYKKIYKHYMKYIFIYSSVK